MKLALLSVLLSSGAVAADSTADVVGMDAAAPTEAAQAEYFRLSQELEKLAARTAWTGVERTYQALIATGVDPRFGDYVIGAHGARAVGDITAAHDRLLAASKLKEEREVLDWLWEIESNYGIVTLACDPGAAELRAESMPFEPDQAHAVEFAMARIAESGTFTGYLPQGKYYFANYEVKVIPRVLGTKLDLRTGDAKPGKKPKKKKG